MITTLKEYENGGKIDVYEIVDRTAADYEEIYASCNFFALQGAYVLILPRFDVTVSNPDYRKIYAFLKDTPYWGKCPDFLVNGVWYEHEGYEKGKDLSDRQKRADTFCKMMTRGVKQSDRIIIEDCEVGRRWAKKVIFKRVHFEKQNIEEVYIRTDAGLELLYKKGAG
jgi:hypothetical protein